MCEKEGEFEEEGEGWGGISHPLSAVFLSICSRRRKAFDEQHWKRFETHKEEVARRKRKREKRREENFGSVSRRAERNLSRI
jgi:hypothetical protein